MQLQMTSPHKKRLKSKIVVEQNKLLPVNPEQFHGNTERSEGCRFLAFVIWEDFLSQIAHSMGGKGEIHFQNENLQISSDLQNLIRLFIEEASNRQAGYEFVLESLCAQITVNLLRRAKTNLPASAGKRNYAEKENINRVIIFLNEQYNSDFSLEDVARLANLSPYHFIRVFKAQTGKTPYEYLLEIKLAKARELLRFSNHTITEVCCRCGFKNPGHFSVVFKRKVGVSPSEYRGAFLER